MTRKKPYDPTLLTGDEKGLAGGVGLLSSSSIIHFSIAMASFRRSSSILVFYYIYIFYIICWRPPSTRRHSKHKPDDTSRRSTLRACQSSPRQTIDFQALSLSPSSGCRVAQALTCKYYIDIYKCYTLCIIQCLIHSNSTAP